MQNVKSSVSAAFNGFLEAKPWRRIEVIIALGIILLAFITRFYDLETRVMSHDESQHTYFSWFYAENGSYQHTPITHGPLQFHLLAATYKIFGDTDATSRFPAAAAGVLAVALVFFYRRWLGKNGALIAMAMMLISPFFLFYGRYARNDSLIMPVTLLMFIAVLRYYETRQTKYLYLLTASLTLHFLIKETAFLYVVELMLFLGVLFTWNLLRRPWNSNRHLAAFIAGLIFFLLGTVTLFFRIRTVAGLENSADIGPSPALVVSLLIAVLGIIAMVIAVLSNHGKKLRTEFPSLDMLIVCLTLMLPQLAAFPANLLGWDPLNYESVEAIVNTSAVVVVMIAITVTSGIFWDWRRWQIIAAIFFFPYVLLYTSLFTNLVGLATGIVGSFGYWFGQQEIQRGGQPWYYYAGVQIPIYEYLAALGTLLAAAMGIRFLLQQKQKNTKAQVPNEDPEFLSVNGVAFLGYWTVISLLLFSYAGERMPWLTIHIVLPMILVSGWAFGRVISHLHVRIDRSTSTIMIPVLVLISMLSGAYSIVGLLGWVRPPFGEIPAEGSISFVFAAMFALAFATGFLAAVLSRRSADFPLARWAAVAVIGGLFVLTARTSLRASFQNSDYATEFLVYAHSERGVKSMLAQLNEFSIEVLGDASLNVAFDVADQSGDSGVAWPLTWYFRNNPNASSFGPEITRDLRSNAAIIVSDNNFARVGPLVENQFQQFDYIRMVWPIQDYWNLTLERLTNVVKSPELQKALWDIWFDRDYFAYGELTSRDYSLENWQPSDRMRLYVRNDIYAEATGTLDESIVFDETFIVDPYKDGILDLESDLILSDLGIAGGSFNAPRSIAIGQDGSLFVADSGNHRILHLNPQGEILNVWGRYANSDDEPAPEGTFNEPWGIAVDSNGFVYVADTWNHRIQKFTEEGVFLLQWGQFGTDGDYAQFWGPRTVAIDNTGNLYVADTGNKRIVVFDQDGKPQGVIGGGGFMAGELDEPIGLGISNDDRLFVADTWNGRVQIFGLGEEGEYEFLREWPIDGWYGQSLENKPYLAIGPQGQICVTDPEGFRVLCFSTEGEFLFGWGGFGNEANQFGLPIAINIDEDGKVWVSDSGNNRIMRFSPPWESYLPAP